MHDAIITKQQLETKAIAILAGYIAIDLIFIQVLASSEPFSTIMWFAFFACVGFTIAVVFFMEIINSINSINSINLWGNWFIPRFLGKVWRNKWQ